MIIMPEEKFSKLEAFFMIILVVIIICILVIVAYNSSTMFERRYEVVEGKIINSYPIQDDRGKIDYLVVTFGNGETYKIKSGQTDLDLTVNSKLILELSREYKRSWWWEEYQPVDDYYVLQKLIKVPS